MPTTNVLFGGLPINVSITQPTLNTGLSSTTPSGTSCSTGGTPVTNSCVCPTNPGNGIGTIQQGQNPVPVVALVPLQAFVAVVQSVGGVILANINDPAHRDVVWGVTLNSVTAGQIASVVWGGPVVNTINGTGGWNFVLNQPVYVGANGVLTQTAPVTGWVQPVGFALSQNTIQLFPARAVPPSASLSAPVVSVLTFSPNVVADFNAAGVFDLVLTDDTTLSMSNGVDGREVVFRIRQNATGGNVLTLDTDVIGGSAYTPLPTTANAQAIYKFQYQGASGTYVCLSTTIL